MPFDGFPPAASPPAMVVDHMLSLLATRDNWLRGKETELDEDGVLRVCLLGAYKRAIIQLPWQVRLSAGQVVLQTLNEVICETSRSTDYPLLKRLTTRYGLLKRSLMVAFNDDGAHSYRDVMTVLRTTRARVQPVMVVA